MKFVIPVLVVIALFFAMTGCSKVPAGEVGVKVNLYGDDRGVQQQVLGPGWYFVSPWQQIFTFPTFTQNTVWVREDTGESPGDESFTFGTIEGMSVNADIGLSYHVDPAKVADVFQKYRKGIYEITHLYVRNMVRDELVRVASTKTIEQVYGAGKVEIMNEVQRVVAAEVAPIGIVIEKIYWIGNVRLPESVIAALNAKIEATQLAQQRQNEVETAKAEAQKQIEKARGEAESIRIAAEAQAKANEILNQSLTSELVRYRAIDRWDGKLPVTALSDSATAMIALDRK